MRSRYPLMACNFRVEVAGETLRFSEVNGLALSYETVTYRHGLSFLEGESVVRWRPDRFVSVTLKKGLVPGGTALTDWLSEGEVRSMAIRLCDDQGLPRVSWHIGRALPVKLEAPALSAGGPEVLIETFEIQASRITVEHH